MARLTSRFTRTVMATALVALAGAAWAGGQPEKVLAGLAAGQAEYVPSEMLVQFKPGVAQALRQAALDHVGAKFVKHIRGDLHKIKLPAGFDMAMAVRLLHAQDAVDFAEPNWIMRTQKVSNDTYYKNGQMWGMQGDSSPLFQNQYGSQAAEAWDKGHFKCKDVMVADIDEGVQYTHPDIKKNHWVNPFEIPNNGKDDDGNGYVDDVDGWDFFHNDKTVYDGTFDSHGTHTAGTIGAKGGNKQGVAGVCWTIKMLHAKFLDHSSGPLEAGIEAIDYVTDMKVRHNLNLVASNNSWGCQGCFSQAMKDSIDAAGAANILFIAAAGNNSTNNDSNPFYPASFTSSNIISVAAIGSGGVLASFSNYGATSVDICGPGVSIISTLPPDTYGNLSGTSMATPHVTGAVALYAQNHPGLTAAQLKKAILDSATPTPSCAGKTVTGGRLNVSGF